MTVKGYEPCKRCGHMGMSHGDDGGCLATVAKTPRRGKRRTPRGEAGFHQCSCRAFVPGGRAPELELR